MPGPTDIRGNAQVLKVTYMPKYHPESGPLKQGSKPAKVSFCPVVRGNCQCTPPSSWGETDRPPTLQMGEQRSREIMHFPHHFLLFSLHLPSSHLGNGFSF